MASRPPVRSNAELIEAVADAISRQVQSVLIPEDWGLTLLHAASLANRIELSIGVGRMPDWSDGTFSIGLSATPLFAPEPGGIAESVHPSVRASLGGLRPGSWRRGSKTDAQVAGAVVEALMPRLARFLERYGSPLAFAQNFEADVYDDPVWIETEELRAYCLFAGGRSTDARESLRRVVQAGGPSERSDDEDHVSWRRIQDRAEVSLGFDDRGLADRLDAWERHRRQALGLPQQDGAK